MIGDWKVWLPLWWLHDRLREREVVRTNTLERFPVGSLYVNEKGSWRVTKHRSVATEPWDTIIVYGVPH